MAIVPQVVTVNFQQGVNTKTDPWQVPIGQFLSLENSVFTIQGQLKKRNGYGLVTTIPEAATITTYFENLVALSPKSLTLYSQDTGTSINTGYIQPMSLSVIPQVRRATSQNTVDTAIAPNGLSCSVWLDSDGNSYYQINDSINGGTIVATKALTTSTDVSATMPRVFILGNYFFITYIAAISGTDSLRYIAVPYANPTMSVGPVTISAQISSLSAGYDGIKASLAPDILYLAWNGSDGGGALRICSITSSLIINSTVVVTSTTANLISTTFDYVLNQLWVSFYNSGANTIDTLVYSQNLTAILAKTTVVSSITLNNGLTSTANNGVVSLFYEVSNFYGYDATLRTDYISTNTCTVGGTVGTPSILIRSVGLGSKAIYLPSMSKSYMFVAYGSAYQPSYFLIDSSANIIGKCAYENGGGYIVNQILPQINLSTNSDGQSVFQTGYLFKDFLASIANPVGPMGSNSGPNNTQGAANSVPVYSQTGINLSTFTFNTPAPVAETGNILHMGAGFPWMFDGVKPVEHQFHVWPDAVEVSSTNTGGGMLAQQYYYQAIYYWVDGQGNPQQSAPSIPVSTTVTAGSGLIFDAVFTSGAYTATVNSATGLFVGQLLTDNTTSGNVTAGTYITQIVGTTITVNIPFAGSSASSPGDILQTVNQGVATVYIPTLRLTAKTSTNKVILRLYRWSTANQNYYEVTSVQNPTLNNPAVDYITFTDSKNDIAIIGNSLIYTTGGVVEDIAAPSFSVCTMFDDRLWVVDAEDPFTLWYSKQVLNGTGVEFSDLFTYYVAPSTGAQGSTGPITALAPMDTELVIFKKDAMYYINGSGPDNTGSNSTYSQPIYISSTVGCTNPNSIILTDGGIMFQSDKGIWLLGRNLQPSYIGMAVEKYVIGNTVTSASVIPGTTQVRFTLNTGITVMYDYLYQQWGTFTNTPAISATLYQGLHTYLNKYGQIVEETPGIYYDISTPVLLSFTTNYIQLQGLSGYQRLWEIQMIGSYITPHLLNTQLGYNFGALSEQAVIEPVNGTGVYGSDQLYGQTSPYGGLNMPEQWRVQQSTQVCQSFQISISEVYDPSMGIAAGAGFTLSSLTCVIGILRGYRPLPAATSAGTN